MSEQLTFSHEVSRTELLAQDLHPGQSVTLLLGEVDVVQELCVCDHTAPVVVDREEQVRELLLVDPHLHLQEHPSQLGFCHFAVFV